ncbi:MAG: type I methionyl aminopeptidase [Pantoea sp. Brub]|nr:type I methionyl aminopeptidase [Pantoea sp. Brub]
MTITIKNCTEIKKMRIAGRLAAEVLEMIEKYIKPGITTSEIDKICHNYIINKQKAIPACLGYRGFPNSICTSVNEVVCHGIPNNNDVLKNGDIINIDITIIKDLYHGDTSKMFIVGTPNIQNELLCRITQKSLYLSLKFIKPGIHINVLGEQIQKYVEENNFSVVREYCGHGIGKKFHEEPQVLHYRNKFCNTILKKGMIFTVEPMVNIGGYQVNLMQDGWTVKTKDNSLSAQYEHTVLVTSNGCEILTLRNDETIPSVFINTK